MSPVPMLNPDILTKKVGPLPVWGYLGIGAAGLYLMRRRSGSGSDVATENVGPAPSRPMAGGGAGGAGGGHQPTPQGYITQTSAFPTSDQAVTAGQQSTPANQSGPVAQQSSMMAQPNSGAPAFQQLTTFRESSPHIPEQPVIVPNKLSMLQANSFNQVVSNPVGSADAAAAQMYYGMQTYNPSQLDYASEQPGGLAYKTTPEGAIVYQDQLGTGPVVAPQDQINGERYDMSGRRIL